MFKEIEETFTSYVGSNFDLTDKVITSRMAHCFRVQQLCKLIADAEGFNENDSEIVAIAGLLHDYGRFYQWEKYHSFKDIMTEDHGNLAIKLLFEKNEITNYTEKLKNYDEIFDAIKFHNKLFLPENISLHNQKTLMVVKDADKIDLWYEWSINENNQETIENQDDLSEMAIEQFLNKRLVKYTKEMTQNDLILARLSFIFDINYQYSFEYIKETELLSKIYNNIIDKKKFKKYFEIAFNYLKEKTTKGVI